MFNYQIRFWFDTEVRVKKKKNYMSLISTTVKIIINAPKTYIWGNFTYFAQAPLGLFCITDGGCGAIDAATCINPVAKPFFITGSIFNLGAGVCMITSFGLGYICVPAAVGVGLIGTGCRKIGSYALKTGNRLEIKPTLTKTTSFVSTVIESVEDPFCILGNLF